MLESRLFRSVCALALVAATLSIARADDPELDARIARLVETLGHEDVDRREAASKELVGIGRAALAALESAARRADDPEVRARAIEAAATIRERSGIRVAPAPKPTEEVPPPDFVPRPVVVVGNGGGFLGVGKGEGEDAVVGSVTAGSPAERAGLRVGDRVVRIGARRIATWEELIAAVSARRPGEVLPVVVERQGVPVVVVAVLAGKPPARPMAPAAPGYLGVTCRGTTNTVASVVDGSAAARAGLREGDVIFLVGGQRVTDFDSLDGAVRARPAGSAVPIGFERAGARGYCLAVLGARPEGLPAAPAPPPPPVAPAPPVEKRRGYLGVSQGTSETEGPGIVLGVVVAGFPAAKAGLLAGDRILSIDGVAVATWAEFTRSISSRSPGTQVRLLVRRGEGERTFAATLASAPD